MPALLRASHPAPGAAVTAVAGILALATGLPILQVLLVVLVMALDQLSVGWSNDWIDADRDRVAGRGDKPVATGEVAISTVRAAALASLAASLALGFALGAPAGAAHAVFVLSAWSYNAGLKRTALSVVPYALSFGLLPAIVTLAGDPARWPVWWVTVAGAALGVAAHLVNVLPDLEDDAATGVRGFPHRLGARASGIGAFAVLAVTALMIGVNAAGPASTIGGALVLGASACGVILVLRGHLSRILFVLILISALLIVALLALAGNSIVSR